jgi:hypothetical protein
MALGKVIPNLQNQNRSRSREQGPIKGRRDIVNLHLRRGVSRWWRDRHLSDRNFDRWQIDQRLRLFHFNGRFG